MSYSGPTTGIQNFNRGPGPAPQQSTQQQQASLNAMYARGTAPIANGIQAPQSRYNGLPTAGFAEKTANARDSPPVFDASDFPALGGKARPGVSARSSEDFPALNGQSAVSGRLSPATSAGALSPSRSQSAQAVRQAQRQQQQQQQALSGKNTQIQLSQKTIVTMPPSNSITSASAQHAPHSHHPEPNHIDDHRFDLMGLLSVIRMTDPDLNTLALGTDLTTLGGLNLNSTESLYPTFSSPWSATPTTMRREPDYVLPYCYYMQPPALKTSHLSKFQLETLLYIFYNMPKDTLQVYAAKELYHRNCRFHKESKLWFIPPAQQGGQLQYFDINTWTRRNYRDSELSKTLGPSKDLRFMEPQEVQNL